MSIFIIAFLVLIIAWILGWVAFHVASWSIHILLVAANGVAAFAFPARQTWATGPAH